MTYATYFGLLCLLYLCYSVYASYVGSAIVMEVRIIIVPQTTPIFNRISF